MSPAKNSTAEAPTYERGWLKAFWYWLTSTSIWIGAKLFFRLKTKNRHNVPSTGPVVLLANHQSHLDPPLVGGATKRQLSYLARDTLFKGALGPLIRSYDAVPVDRDGSGLAGIRAILKRLKQGGAVLLFPEGTRTPDGELQSLKPGFIALVRRSRAVIVPLGFDGPYRAWPKGQKLPTLFSPIAMHYGEPIRPEEVAELDDKQLLARIAKELGSSLLEARVMNGAQSSDR